MPDWYQIHARLVSNTCPIGIKYMPDWYKKKIKKKQRGQERKELFCQGKS